MRPSAFALCFVGFLSCLAVAAPAGAANSRALFDKTIESAKEAMMADPQDALDKTNEALEQSANFDGTERDVNRATALWLRIEANIGLNRLDDAKVNLDEALRLVETAAPNSKLHGDLMRSKGAVAALSGKASDALRYYLAAHQIFRQAKEKRSQAISLQDIGQIYWEAGDYERMLAYSDEAQEIYNDDPAFSLSTNNNRGEAYRILGRRDEAEQAYTQALANARTLKSPMLETRILSNLALAQIENGKLKEAETNALLAERLGSHEEARDWLPFVYGVRAKLAVEKKDDRLAMTLLQRLFNGVDLDKTDVTYKEFHKLAADLYARNGMSAFALSHLQAFQRLESETKDLITSASSQLLEARFNSVNQKTRIAERDVKIERQRRDLVSGLLLAALAIIIVFGYAFFSVRRSRNKVRETNGVLTSVNGKLEQALKAKSDFLAMTSHEIRTPLNGIMGMSQVILADHNLDIKTRERVNLLMGAGQTMQSLVDDLLDAAKMENGSITVKKELTDLRPILIESIQLWQAEAAVKGLQLEFIDEETPLRIYTDGIRFRQVIFNLCANAIKFTPSGKIRVTAKIGGGDTVEVAIEDEGIGIPDDQIEAIFQSFHQVDNAMSRDYGGAGLGLAICQNIIVALGGKITVKSELGKGSRFCISLPTTGSDTSQNNFVAARNVIVVDRDELRLAKLKAVIKPAVDRVFVSQTIDGAQQILETQQASMLVVDTSGYIEDIQHHEYFGQLMTTARTNDTRVIFLLAPESDGTSDAFRALKPHVILQKPLKASALLAEINNAAPFVKIQSEAA